MSPHSPSASAAVKPTKKGDKRQQILDAAVEVFARTGFFGSRVADIAREAEVADGTIYLYFKSKDEILLAVFEQKMQEMIQAATEAMEGLTDPFEKLRRFCSHHMSNVERHRSAAKVLQVELRLSNTFMKEYRPVLLQDYMNLVGRIVEEGQNLGVMRRDANAVIVRRALFGALDEIAMQWILTPNARYGLHESAEQIAEVFVRGLRQDAA